LEKGFLVAYKINFFRPPPPPPPPPPPRLVPYSCSNTQVYTMDHVIETDGL
jgi:hypothetical protein